MAVYVCEKPRPDLNIQVVEKNGEVHLVYNNHAFVRCRTTEKGENVVEVVDIDTGVRHSTTIEVACWSH